MKVNNDLTVSSDDLEKFEQQIGITFNDDTYLIEALLHRSYSSGDESYLERFVQVNELEYPNNEKLEFLGDSVLSLIVSNHFYCATNLERYANEHGKSIECTLTEVKKVLVSNKQLKPLANKLHLDEYILCSGLEDITNIYADVIEALIGGIYCANGYVEAKKFVHKFFDIEGALGKIGTSNPKGDVKEMCDAYQWNDPDYKLIDMTGPDHKKHFTVELYIQNEPVAIGSSSTKKEAEADAARNYLELLRNQHECCEQN